MRKFKDIHEYKEYVDEQSIYELVGIANEINKNDYPNRYKLVIEKIDELGGIPDECYENIQNVNGTTFLLIKHKGIFKTILHIKDGNDIILKQNKIFLNNEVIGKRSWLKSFIIKGYYGKWKTNVGVFELNKIKSKSIFDDKYKVSIENINVGQINNQCGKITVEHVSNNYKCFIGVIAYELYESIYYD